MKQTSSLFFIIISVLVANLACLAEEGDFRDPEFLKLYHFSQKSTSCDTEKAAKIIDEPKSREGEKESDTEPDVVGPCVDCDTHAGHDDTCTQLAPGKTCKMVENDDLTVTKYCCDWVAGEGGKEACDCEREYKNPCETEADCLKCMIYAEAGGSNAAGTPIPQACRDAVKCTQQERLRNNDNYEGYCDIGEKQQGDTSHFTPYKCVCDSRMDNQKYCDCCSGNITNPAEQTAIDDAERAARSRCTLDPRPNQYDSNNNGVPSGCTAVPVPGCPTRIMTFYRC